MAEQQKPKARKPRATRRPFADVIAQKQGEIRKLSATLTKKATGNIEDVAQQITRIAKDIKRWHGYQRQLEIAGELAALRDGNTIRIPPDKLPLLDELERLQKES